MPPAINLTTVFSNYKMEFFLPKQSQKSRSVLLEGSRSLGLFRKGKTSITAKFHMTDLVIFSHSREKKSSPYSLINTGMFDKNLDVCYKIYLHLLGFFFPVI